MVGIGLAASLLLTTTLAHGDSFPFANKEQEVDYRTQNSEDGKTAACPGPGASGAYPLKPMREVHMRAARTGRMPACARICDFMVAR